MAAAEIAAPFRDSKYAILEPTAHHPEILRFLQFLSARRSKKHPKTGEKVPFFGEIPWEKRKIRSEKIQICSEGRKICSEFVRKQSEKRKILTEFGEAKFYWRFFPSLPKTPKTPAIF